MWWSRRGRLKFGLEKLHLARMLFKNEPSQIRPATDKGIHNLNTSDLFWRPTWNCGAACDHCRQEVMSTECTIWCYAVLFLHEIKPWCCPLFTVWSHLEIQNLAGLLSKSKFWCGNATPDTFLFKDRTFAALPPLLWAIWTLLVLGAPIPRWTGMSAWVSSIRGVRPQGDGHTADGSQRGAKVTSSSLHPMEPSSYFTASGLRECVCGGHVLAASHLSTMRTGKRETSNYVGWHSRWYLIHLWSHIVNASHITVKMWVKDGYGYFCFGFGITWCNTTYLGKVRFHCIFIPCNLSWLLLILIRWGCKLILLMQLTVALL